MILIFVSGRESGGGSERGKQNSHSRGVAKFFFWGGGPKIMEFLHFVFLSAILL